MSNFESNPETTPESRAMFLLADFEGIVGQVKAGPPHKRIPLSRLAKDDARALESSTAYENLVLSHKDRGVEISLRGTGQGTITLFAERYPPERVGITENS